MILYLEIRQVWRMSLSMEDFDMHEPISKYLLCFDGVDTDYLFYIYEINQCPSEFNAVYMFCKTQVYPRYQSYIPLYIGKTNDVAKRLNGHERLMDAINQGATHLLVHVPGYKDLIKYTDAEQRLINYYDPPMNSRRSALGPGLAFGRGFPPAPPPPPPPVSPPGLAFGRGFPPAPPPPPVSPRRGGIY